MFELAQLVWDFLTNPNVAYLLLIAGVWCVVMAVSIPGIGLPEAGAVICLALAAVGLSQMPVNVAGLGLIGLALGLSILEFRFMAHGAFLGVGALVMLIGSLLLFRVEGPVQAAFSWVTAVVPTAIFTVSLGFIVYKGLGVRKLPALQNPDSVVGTRGMARTKINGEGAVYAGGEEWSAYADTPIPAGSPVTVVARDGLKVKVTRA